MDINICIDKLGLNANRYRLNQSNTPHEIIEWDSDNPNTQPSQAELESTWTEYKAEYDSLAYARSRKQEYDKLNQWEMQFDDQRDGTTTWVDSINEIKSQFPKG
jgi:hypothetical protein